MAEKQLHNFELPNSLKWNTDSRRTPRPKPSIRHSPRAHKLTEEEKKVVGTSMVRSVVEHNNNVVRNEKVDVKKKKKGKSMKMKVSKKEGNVCVDVVKKQSLVIKIPYKNVDVVGKGKEEIKFQSEQSKEVVGNSKETDRIDGKTKDVKSNGQGPIKIKGKGKNVMTFEGEKNEVRSNGKEPIIKEVVEAKKRQVQSKGKRMEKNVERKGGKQEENVTDFVDEATGKSWNLRSRSNMSLITNICGSELKASGSNGSTSTKAEKGKTRPQTRNEKDIWERLNIAIALTPREIEEDLYAMGVKKSRKVKKRPKHVQNIINALSPGNNLTNISADRYHVSADSIKKQG